MESKVKTTYMDPNTLVDEINRFYHLNIQQIELHREMIGKVYFLRNSNKRYVFKIYRSFKTRDAEQTVRILDYLNKKDYPSISIIKTNQNHGMVHLNCEKQPCVGILYDYIEGVTPDGKVEAEDIAKQIAELHNLMEIFPEALNHKTKNEYIDDYIAIMRALNFDSEKTQELEQYGNQLWERITKLPKTFCHGDLHTGNMIRNRNGVYVLFDFDDASGDYASMDVAYMSDDTHFNQFSELMIDKTMRLFERFYSGYAKVRSLSEAEINAIFDFIAVRHFQILSRIVRCQGLQCLSKETCEEQYGWLMNWQELTSKKQF